MEDREPVSEQDGVSRTQLDLTDLKFKDISIEDRQEIESFLLKYSSFCLSAFTFSSLIAWSSVYHYQWAVSLNTLLIKFLHLEDNNEHFMQPVGEFPEALQDAAIKLAETLSYRLTIFGVSNTFLGQYPVFTSHFERIENRDMDNYIYSALDLADLKGEKYQPKRNLLNQFEAQNKWTSEPVTSLNIPACFEVIHAIYIPDALDEKSYLAKELKALAFVLNHFSQFNQEGILIRIDGKPVAFSIYEHLNNSTCVVHFEKAIRTYKGLYQLINRETAKKIKSKGCEFINREEDLGLEGLRKAKLSYYPLELCPAHALVFRSRRQEMPDT